MGVDGHQQIWIRTSITEIVGTVFSSKMPVMVGAQLHTVAAGWVILDLLVYAWQTAKLIVAKLRQARLPELQSL